MSYETTLNIHLNNRRGCRGDLLPQNYRKYHLLPRLYQLALRAAPAPHKERGEEEVRVVQVTAELDSGGVGIDDVEWREFYGAGNRQTAGMVLLTAPEVATGDNLDIQMRAGYKGYGPRDINRTSLYLIDRDLRLRSIGTPPTRILRC
jgi:hypothetical protein